MRPRLSRIAHLQPQNDCSCPLMFLKAVIRAVKPLVLRKRTSRSVAPTISSHQYENTKTREVGTMACNCCFATAIVLCKGRLRWANITIQRFPHALLPLGVKPLGALIASLILICPQGLSVSGTSDLSVASAMVHYWSFSPSSSHGSVLPRLD